jgi:ATP-dependent helicase HrpB
MRRDAPLPIDPILPELRAALRAHGTAILVAPPGAGKTTRVPLALAAQDWADGKKIMLLEPRRIAARAAAARMAATLGEDVGATVGYRVRFASKVSSRTRIEVVTGGIFTRHLLEHPELEGVAAVLFDEFHERSLDSDVGLALASDLRQGLREDLKLVLMSATLEGQRLARMLANAPVIESAGRAFAVDTRHLGRDARLPIEPQVADAVMRALRTEQGSVLAFLPGAAEIRRTETLLRVRLDERRLDGVDIAALHGSLDAGLQDRAIAPAPPGRRKVVLATSIAETSLTIEGVRIVVDSGFARLPRYEPDVGLSRLETVRVSRASADQRRGRAGRTEPGICYRLWDEPQTASLEPVHRPEILAADLSGFVLDLAYWGVRDPSAPVFLDPPPPAVLRQARALLMELGAIDDECRITELGRRLRRLPLAPRLARMVLRAEEMGAGERGAQIALVLSEPGLGGMDVDIRERVDQLARDRSSRAAEARAVARQWAQVGASLVRSTGAGMRASIGPGLHVHGRGAHRGCLSGPGCQEPWRGGLLHSRQWQRRAARSRIASGARAFSCGRGDQRRRGARQDRAGCSGDLGGNRGGALLSYREPRSGHL